jgi:PKD repeat protein
MKLKNNHITNRLKYALLCTAFFCCSFASAQLSADFSASQTSGCTPILVQFTDQSAGKPAQWKWDLGNGTVSYLQNPSATYLDPGKYSIKLIIQSQAKTDSVVKENYITVYAPPSVDFIAANNNGCTPFKTSFADKSNPANGSLTKWEWDLGDGKLSNEQNPAYTYINTGDYNITLRVTNSFGCTASIRKEAFVKANGIKADFNLTDVSTCTDLLITFYNGSYGSGNIAYKWSLGDKDTTAAGNFTHKYATDGTYPVTLIAKNNFGCVDSIVKSVLVNPLVSAGFSADKLSACDTTSVINFKSKNVTGNSYLWNFGDSTGSTLAAPSHIYSDTGHYTVKLVMAVLIL